MNNTRLKWHSEWPENGLSQSCEVWYHWQIDEKTRLSISRRDSENLFHARISVKKWRPTIAPNGGYYYEQYRDATGITMLQARKNVLKLRKELE